MHQNECDQAPEPKGRKMRSDRCSSIRHDSTQMTDEFQDPKKFTDAILPEKKQTIGLFAALSKAGVEMLRHHSQFVVFRPQIYHFKSTNDSLCSGSLPNKVSALQHRSLWETLRILLCIICKIEQNQSEDSITVFRDYTVGQTQQLSCNFE